MISKLSFRFPLSLLIGLGIAFLIHLAILSTLQLPLWGNMIVTSYIMNFLLALAIFYTLYFLRKRLSNAIGFLFMGGSLLKFLVFFLVFYPSYKNDGKMQGIEFAAFFVPYVIALILETYFASKMLKDLEKKSE